MKRYALILILLVIMPVIANSATVLEYNETDYINLKPEATDPDNDSLTYFFSSPLTNQGTWQTAYGDAGIYNAKVTVSDGRMLTSENITLIINKKEELPVIEVISQESDSLYIIEGDSIFFNIKATDLNKDILNITWLLDEKLVSDNLFYTYQSDYYSQGNHTIEVLVSDGINTVSHEWDIEVEDFDRSDLLDAFTSITINETNTVKFLLPDFKTYFLNYNISEPLGNKAEWKTTYDDAGLYTITIRIWDDEEFEAEKKIKVLVEDVDRPTDFLKNDVFWVSENEELDIFLNYTDPDGDNVDVVAYDLPEGAYFENNHIIWIPNFDVVTKDTVLDDIARRYHVMNKAFIVYANATSQNFTAIQDIDIRVFNTNRPPKLENIMDVTVYEGEAINFELSSSDLDNDTLSYSFEGAVEKNGYKTRIGQSGTYIIKVIVSDGFLEDFKYAKVNILPINQPPILKNIPSTTINENQQLEILLEAKDPDGDNLTYSVSPLPKGAYLQGNKFVWLPDYDTVQGERSNTFELEFTVADNLFNTTKNTQITVNDVNRQPIITTSAQIDNKEFYEGDEILLYLNIFDPDDDLLSYRWQSSAFDNFEGNNTMAIKYDSAGKKKVSVIASDGKESVKREWEFTIKKRPELNLIYLNK